MLILMHFFGAGMDIPVWLWMRTKNIDFFKRRKVGVGGYIYYIFEVKIYCFVYFNLKFVVSNFFRVHVFFSFSFCQRMFLSGWKRKKSWGKRRRSKRRTRRRRKKKKRRTKKPLKRIENGWVDFFSLFNLCVGPLRNFCSVYCVVCSAAAPN